MSAPDTNMERQEQNHKPSLLGIKGAMAFGLLMLACAVAFAVNNGQAPTAETQFSTEAERAASSGSSFDPYEPGTNVSN